MNMNRNRKIKKFYSLIIICLVVLLCGCGKESPPVERPPVNTNEPQQVATTVDFNFVIDFNHAFTVNTYENKLTEKDLYTMDVIYEAEFHFTNKQMENIYAEFLKRNLNKIKDGTDVGKIQSIPPEGVYFTYTSGGETISIICSDKHLHNMSKKRKVDFVEFADLVVSYIKDSQEYKDAPQIFYGWE